MRGLSVLVVALALLVGSASAGPHHLWERQPSGQTAYDFISGAGNYTVFTRALADAPSVEELLKDPSANITVFVPFDTTSAALLQNVSNPNALISSVQGKNLTPIVTPLLAYHIVNGTIDITAVQAGQNETLETILKYANLSVSNTDGNYSVNDAKVEGSPSGVRVSNGIVYAIQYPVTPLYFLNITTPQLVSSLASLAQQSGGGGGGGAGTGGGSGGGARVKRDFDLVAFLKGFAPRPRAQPLWRNMLL